MSETKKKGLEGDAVVSNWLCDYRFNNYYNILFTINLFPE